MRAGVDAELTNQTMCGNHKNLDFAECKQFSTQLAIKDLQHKQNILFLHCMFLTDDHLCSSLLCILSDGICWICVWVCVCLIVHEVCADGTAVVVN